MSADLQSSGKWHRWKDLLTRNEIEGANSNAHDFKITGEIPSGPGDLFILRDLRCFRISSVVQEIELSFSQTKGSKEGRLVKSSQVKTDEK